MEAEVCQVAPSTWARKPIEDICVRITSGGTPSRRNRKFFQNGTWAWVKSQELQDRWIDDTEEKITNEAVACSSAKVLPPNTVLIALYGATVGQLGILRREMTSNQACCAMIVDPRQADFRYLFYQLIAARPFLKRLATGAAQQNLSGQLIRSLQLPFPPLKEQQAIACILGALDDKIELDRRMNQTLEAMARAIFKSWFVDFDPVRAKAAGEQPSGMAPHIAELFPDSFEDSEIGEVPRGWGVYSLPALIDINPSRQIPRGVVAPYLDMASMPTRGHAPHSWIEREVGSGMKFINGDTLLARITPCLENGKTAYVDFLKDGEVGWGSTEYIVLRPREPIPTIFAYLLARSNDFRTFAIQRMTGSSGRQRVPSDSLADYRLAAPAIDSLVFKAFGRVVNPLFERVRSAMEQSRTLTALRDSLLPKLISGEVRVPDAERIVGRCV